MIFFRYTTFWMLLLFGFLIAYFAYHGVTGERGLWAKLALEQRIQQSEKELAKLKAIRQRLSRDIALMEPERIDPDMLEELARRRLNFAHEDEIVLWLRQDAQDIEK